MTVVFPVVDDTPKLYITIVKPVVDTDCIYILTELKLAPTAGAKVAVTTGILLKENETDCDVDDVDAIFGAVNVVVPVNTLFNVDPPDPITVPPNNKVLPATPNAYEFVIVSFVPATGAPAKYNVYALAVVCNAVAARVGCWIDTNAISDVLLTVTVDVSTVDNAPTKEAVTPEYTCEEPATCKFLKCAPPEHCTVPVIADDDVVVLAKYKIEDAPVIPILPLATFNAYDVVAFAGAPAIYTVEAEPEVDPELTGILKYEK